MCVRWLSSPIRFGSGERGAWRKMTPGFRLNGSQAPTDPGWRVRRFEAGDLYMFDGFWHCHFVANPSPEPRLAFTMILEKSFTGLPPWLQWVNHFVTFNVVQLLHKFGQV